MNPPPSHNRLRSPPMPAHREGAAVVVRGGANDLVELRLVEGLRTVGAEPEPSHERKEGPALYLLGHRERRTPFRLGGWAWYIAGGATGHVKASRFAECGQLLC